MKIERMMTILTLLLNREKVTAASLADRFEVSPRTIQRDMDALSAAGFPVYANRGREGGYYLHEDYKLDKSTLSDQELMDINAILQGFTAGLSDKFKSMKQGRSTSIRTSNVMVDLSDWGGSDYKQDKLRTIHKALENKRLLVFRYANMKGEWSARAIEPVILHLKVNIWYLYGWCRKRQDYRMFKVSRMSQVQVQEETYEGVHEVPQGLGAENLGGQYEPTEPVLIHFPKFMIAKMADWFDIETMSPIDNDLMAVKIDWQIDPWLVTFLLSFGTDIEVISPAYLRQALQAKALEVLAHYGSDPEP